MSEAVSREADAPMKADAVAGRSSSALPADPAMAGRRVVTYDFKRPDKFSLEQIRTVFIIHEAFARLATVTLSSALRSIAQVRVASVDQMTFEEFLRSVPATTTNAIIAMEPLRGQAVFEIDPSITMSLLDRLLGGSGEGGRPMAGLTDLETSLMAGLIGRLLGNLRESWAQVIDLRPRLASIETNPQYAMIVPPMEMVITVSIEAIVGDARGFMNFCVPFLTIEPILSKLSAKYWYSLVRGGTTRDDARNLLGHMETFDIDAEILVDAEKLSPRALGGLKPGSLVRLPGRERGEAWFRMGGRRLFTLKERPSKRGKGTSYEVQGEAIDLRMPAFDEAERPEGPAEIDGRFSLALEEFKKGIGSVLGGISSGIAALKEKQDELTDQLALGPPREGPRDEALALEPKRPFDFVRGADPLHVLNFLQQEHPQLIALVLSYLEPQEASALFEKLPKETQADVARRIACMERASPEVIKEVERALLKRTSALSTQDYVETGGVESVVGILNLVDRSTEKYVVESLERSDPALAEGIKQRMFVFEDISLLDQAAAASVLRRIDGDTLARAMKTVPEIIKDFILRNMSKGDAEALKAKSEALGKVRLSEVDAAQQRVVAKIREMEENGEIMVARPDETVG